MESAASRNDRTAWPKLIHGLSDKSRVVRVASAEGLGQLNRSRAVPYLTKSLADADPEVRMRAAESIGLVAKSGRAPIELVKALRDRDELVRVAATIALGMIRDKRSLPALRRALNDKSAMVRKYACVTIGKFAQTEDLARLKRGLKKERSEIAKLGYCHGLYLLGETDLLYNILALLTSQDYRIRCSTAHAMVEIRTNKYQRTLIVEALRERYQVEQTVAAKSSFRTALRRLTIQAEKT